MRFGWTLNEFLGRFRSTDSHGGIYVNGEPSVWDIRNCDLFEANVTEPTVGRDGNIAFPRGWTPDMAKTFRKERGL